MKNDPNWYNVFKLMYFIAVLECLNSVIKFFVSIESHLVCTQAGADPGFPVGGHQPSLEGAPTSDMDTF